VIPRNWYGLQ